MSSTRNRRNDLVSMVLGRSSEWVRPWRCCWWGTLALLGLALSCATLSPLPTQGPSGWIEVTSQHFRIRSEMDEKATLKMLTTLEEGRAAMLATIWPDAPAAARVIEVILLRCSTQIQALLQEEPIGVQIRARFPFPSIVVVAGQASGEGLTVAIHELAHEIGMSVLPLYRPRWYLEGAASYLEAMLYDRWSGHLTRGRVSDEQLAWLRSGDRLEARRLLSEDGVSTSDQLVRFERTAWLLFHYLVDYRIEDLQAFQRRLSFLQSPEEAWEEEFHDLKDAEVLDKKLKNYALSGYFKSFDSELPPPRYQARTRAMLAAEAHGVRALLLARSRQWQPSPSGPSPTADITAAFAEDPGAVDAAGVALYTDGLSVAGPHGRLGLAEEVARRHPDSWQAWLMVEAESPRKSLAGLAALDKAYKLAPNELLVIEALAFHFVDMGRIKEALFFSSEAVARHAGATKLLWLHSRLLAHQGRCREAQFFRSAVTRRTAVLPD